MSMIVVRAVTIAETDVTNGSMLSSSKEGDAKHDVWN
jgi:hypothetical protein